MASQKDKSKQFFEEDHSHGLAKRVVLKKTLQAWIPYHLYCGQFSTLYYIDGFSGEGTYEGKKQGIETKVEDFGSPVIALECVIDCYKESIEKSLQKQEATTGISPKKIKDSSGKVDGTMYGLKPPISVELFCVEKQPETFEKLRQNMNDRENAFNTEKSEFMSVTTNVEQCEFKDSEVVNNIEQYVGNDPTFIFLDPFGYSQIPMETVRRLIGENRSLLITLMVGSMNRFKSHMQDKLNKLYGNDKWRKVFDMENPKSRYDCFADVYEETLKENGAYFTYSFPIINDKNRVVYYLVFASTGSRSFEIFKKLKAALNKVSTETEALVYAGYKVRNCEVEWKNCQNLETMATDIFKKFSGKTVPFFTVEKYIWLETPFIYQAKALKILEDTGRITDVIPKYKKRLRKSGTFANVTDIKFDIFRDQFDAQRVFKLPETVGIDKLSQLIFEQFKGTDDVPLSDIKWWLRRSGNLKLKKTALKPLENEGKIIYIGPEPRNRKTYPDDCHLKFTNEAMETNSGNIDPIENVQQPEGAVAVNGDGEVEEAEMGAVGGLNDEDEDNNDSVEDDDDNEPENENVDDEEVRPGLRYFATFTMRQVPAAENIDNSAIFGIATNDEMNNAHPMI